MDKITKILLLDGYSTRTLACVRSWGKQAIPFVSNVTEYRPGLACSRTCEKGTVEELGSLGTDPGTGRNGISPKMGQPQPDRWVRLNPVIAVSS